MTTIDRLGILGIRSYGPYEEAYIKFLRPLTIILGSNGSGKSTIIEAVKMATTGDLPPMVDKGAAFIHDPRIDNQTETKARIRLEFTTLNGDRFVVSRHFQLSLRTGPRGIGYKTEFKTLDQTLRRVDGSKSSFRTSDFNNLLPEVMRVTKPVLNNVIFVHQEDSLWPLGDSKKLKDKFDEIFAATRYTKALETIRRYRRDQGGILRAVKIELMHFEDKVRTLEKSRKEVNDIKVQHDGLRTGQDELTAKLTLLHTDLTAAEGVSTDYKDKQEKFRKHQNDAKHLNQAKDEKYRAMQIHLREISDDEIRTEIDDLERKLDRAGSERSKRAGLIEHLRVEIEAKRGELNRRLAKRGMLEEKEKQHNERLERLEALKKEVSDKGMFLKPLTDVGKALAEPRVTDELEAWTKALDGLKGDADANFSRVRETGDASLDKANTDLNDVRLKVDSRLRDENRMKQELAQKRAYIAATRTELDSLRRSQESTSAADEKLKAREKAYKEKLENNNIQSLKDKISSDKRQITVLREDLALSRKTREQLLLDQTEQSRLALSREAAESKKKDFDSFFENFVELLISSSDLLGTMDDEGSDLLDLKRELRRMTHDSELSMEDKRVKLIEASSRVLSKRDAMVQLAQQGVSETKTELSERTVRKTELQREVDRAKGDLSRTDNELSRMKQQLRNADTELSEVSDSDSENDALTAKLKVDHLVEMFAEVSISSENRRGELRKEHVDALGKSMGDADKALQSVTYRISQLEFGVFMAEGDLHEFEGHPKHMCPACGLHSSKKVDDMRKHLKNRVDQFRDPANLAAAEKRKRAFEGATSVVRKLQTHCENALSAMESFSGSLERLRGVELEEREAKQRFDEKSKLFLELQRSVGARSSVEEIVSQRLEVRQRAAECDRAAKEVSRLEAGAIAGTGETISLSEADKKVQDIEELMQTVQDKMERDARALEREQEDLRLVENRLHAAKERALELKAMSEKYKRLEKEKKELSCGIVETEAAIETIRTSMSALKADLESAEAELATVKAENTYRTKAANGEVSNREKVVHQWKVCVRDVDAYRRSGKERELTTMKMSLGVIEKEIDEKSDDLKGLDNDQQTASDAQNEMKTRIRNLKDNQMYRLQEQSVKVNLREMQRVEREIEEIMRTTGEDPVQKVEVMKEEKNKMNANLHATKAQRHVYRNQYEAKRRELAEAEREGNRKKFDECRIRKQTMELASGDLDRYHRALDQALMAFHTLKMSSINRTIKELWQRTYQGSDIEEIEITSDHSDGRSEGAGVLKRNFNYRVVMRRGQATLDMRGRCSAGQKVLACLVIRLALAESFCTDCGILALDEPTTNLDRKNIYSLAQAIRTIIETRRSQRNFQLVLITHDEEFIEMIGARDFSSDYFKIYKNDLQKSCAKMESLHEVGG